MTTLEEDAQAMLERARDIYQAYMPTRWHPFKRARYQRTISPIRIMEQMRRALIGEAPPIERVAIASTQSCACRGNYTVCSVHGGWV